MNTLSRREEEALEKKVKEHAIKECDSFLREFAECSQGRTISMAWACRSNLKALQNCMYQYTGPESMDQARLEYIRLRDVNAAVNKASPSSKDETTNVHVGRVI